MKSQGKKFEEDFQNSATCMNLDRLKDPPQSFNHEYGGCPKQKVRFSPRNLCDFIGYSYPNQYYFELKSHKNKSFPVSTIVKNDNDKRLAEMVGKECHKGVYSFVIFNFRDLDNATYAVRAKAVKTYIESLVRKSIPFDWVVGNGVEIKSTLKRVRYSYDIEGFLKQGGKQWKQ